jgi:NADH-quinone oxidoreductase subunit J
MAAVLMGGFRPEEPRAMPAVQQAAAAGVQYSNTKELGKLLYSSYLYPLEIAAVILLVAIVAAIALTLRQRKDSRHIDASEQVRVKARDRMQIIKMPPVVAAPPVEPAVVEEKA